MQIFEISFSSYADYVAWQREQKEQAEIQYRKLLQIALHTAMEQYRLENPDGYALIEEYYFKNVTQRKLGEMHGISKSTAGENLCRNFKRLQKLAMQYLEVLTADET